MVEEHLASAKSPELLGQDGGTQVHKSNCMFSLRRGQYLFIDDYVSQPTYFILPKNQSTVAHAELGERLRPAALLPDQPKLEFMGDK